MRMFFAAAAVRHSKTHAAIAQQEAEVAFRRSEHARIVDLVKNRTINSAIEEEKLKQLQASSAALEAAHADVRSADADVNVARAQKKQAQADVAHAKAKLQVAEAELRQTEILMSYSQIRAPFAGLVTQRWVDTGDFVASAATAKPEPLFTVNRIDRLRIVLDVPEADSALVQVGQPASFVVDALKERSFDGQVVRTAGVLESTTRTLRVEAEVADPDGNLRAGMYGMISVTLALRRDAVLVPSRCIRYENTAPFVYCVNQGVVEKRPVRLGYSDGTRTEITDGLGSEDQVIVESRAAVHVGRAVHVWTLR